MQYALLYIFSIYLLCFSFACQSKSDSNKRALHEWSANQTASSKALVNLDSIYDQVVYLTCRIDKSTDRVFAVKKGDKWGISNLYHKLYVPIEYDKIVSVKKSIALLKNGVSQFYDPQLNSLSSMPLRDLRQHYLHHYIATTSTGVALMDYRGEIKGDSTFTDITGPPDGSYYLGLKNKTWKPYDEDGDPIVELNDIATDAANFLNEHKVHLYGYGPIRLGMYKGDVERIMKRKLTESYIGESCHMYHMGDDFLRLNFMFNEQSGKMKLERIYIGTPGILTKSGIGIGSTKEQLIAAYGSKITSQPNHYNQFATDFFYEPSDEKDQKYRLSFRHDGNAIDSYSVGRIPSIFYVEGCL